MKYIIVLFVHFIAFEVSGQMSNLEFMPPNYLRYDISKINQVHRLGSRFFAAAQVRDLNNKADRVSILEFDRNGTLVNEVWIKRDGEGNRINFLSLGVKEEKLYGFYEVEKGDKSLLYLSPINMRDLSLGKRKERIMSGDKSKIIESPLIDLNAKLDIDKRIFERRLYAFIEFEDLDKTVIIRRNPNKNADVPRLEFQVIDQQLNILQEGRLQLTGSNKKTEILDIEIDDQNQVYVLTRTRNNSNLDYALTYFDSQEEKGRTIKLANNEYMQDAKIDILNNNILIAGYLSERKGSRNWKLFCQPLTLESKMVKNFKIISQEEHDDEDEIEIKHSKDQFFVIATNFKASVYTSNNARGQVSRSFSPRRTESTYVFGVDPSGDKKWGYEIPNLIYANTFNFESYQKGYRDLKLDNYLFIERENKLHIIFGMNPMNDSKPKKNGKMRSVLTTSTKKYGIKSVTFNDAGFESEKLIWGNDRRVTPIPALTKRITDNTYFMYGARYRRGSFSFGRIDLK